MIGAGDVVKHLLVHAFRQKLEILDGRFPGLETDFRSGGLHAIRVLLVNMQFAGPLYIYHEVSPGILTSRATGRGFLPGESPRITGTENVTGTFLFEIAGILQHSVGVILSCLFSSYFLSLP